MKEFKVFQQISETPGKIDKLNILKQNDTPQLRKLLYLTYNRFLTYRIKKIDLPVRFNSVQPDVCSELEQLLMLLADHSTGSTEAKNLIKNLLSRCSEEGAVWVSRIITRDLKAGIDESSICKVFPGLLPEFSVQLALPVYSGGKNPTNRWLTMKYPVIAESKLDGCRTVAVCKDGKVTFFSREGHPFDNCEVFAKEILKLRPGTDFCCDGEILARKFNPDLPIAVKNAHSNWVYESGKSMLKNSATTAEDVKEYLVYEIWDIISYEYFSTQGKEGKAVPLTDRKMELCALFERNETEFKSIHLVENVVAWSEDECKALFQKVRDEGGQTYSVLNKKGEDVTWSSQKGEGLMIKKPDAPYSFKRNDFLLKMKEFYTADLRIADAYEGVAGTKYEGMLGGITLVSDDNRIKTDCGSGFDADLRFCLWQSHKRGELVGKIVECSYQELTESGSLRFPVYLRIRDDKTTTNVEA